jgi:hypothetical protein
MPDLGQKRKVDMSEDADHEVRKQRRNFFLYLSPFEGHSIANDNGFVPSSEEAMEAEIKDVLALWLTLQQGKAGEMIANSAWWMTRHMDPDNQLTAESGVGMLDSLTSFAVSVISMLLNSGVISLNEKVEIPDIMLSTAEFFSKDQSEALSLFEDFMNKFTNYEENIEDDEDE